jgi:hypothetical protein
MSDDANDRHVGVSLRVIRAWREPTPEERRQDREQFAAQLAAALEHRARVELLALEVVGWVQ